MSSSQNVSAYLSVQRHTDDEGLAEDWTTIEHLYNEKLWNELTVKLITFVKHKSLQNEKSLLELYNTFISTFETKINPYKLVQILENVVYYIQDKQQAVEFLEKLKEKVKICDLAVWFVKVLQGNIYLEHLKNLEEAKKIIGDLSETLEDNGNVTPVHGKYYMLASQYYKQIGYHSDFYRCGLQFLGCSMDDYPKDNWPQFAFFLGLAALLGDGIYNIGELLHHPILDSLKNTENAWLVELLTAFNEGNILKFDAMKPLWSQIADLSTQELKLRQKISLLCLMEMVFKRPANKRSITFTDISNETRLPLYEVELLVMRALAQGLVRGEIDQVAGVANLTWVQPRVLNKSQVMNMSSVLDVWMQSITSMEQLIETRAGEILTV